MSEWKETNLGQYIKVQGGFAFKSADFASVGVPVIKIKNVRSRYIDMSEADCVSDAIAQVTRDYLLNDGDVVISMTGSGPNAPNSVVGRVARYTGKSGLYLINQRVGRFLIKDTGRVNKRFLFFLLSQQEVQDWLVSNSTGSANQANISNAQIESLQFAFPPFVEQQAIAAVLGALDDKIELNRQMNATLEAMARALFKSWFVDFDPVRAKMEGKQPFAMDAATAALFPSRLVPSPLGDIPEGWEVKQFKDAVNFYNSKRVPLSSREREQRKGSYRYYGATSVMDYVDNYLFDGTYVLVGEDGSVITERGFPFLQYVWGKFWVNNHAHILQGKNGWSTEAVYLILAQSNIQHLVTGAVQPKLSMGNLSALKFVCSSPQITTAFCDQIAVLFEKIKAISNENAELERTRDYLLPKLISGDIRIPDAEKFVEAA